MKASNRTRKIKQKENTSDLILGIGQCKSSFLSTLFSFSHVFGSNTFVYLVLDFSFLVFSPRAMRSKAMFNKSKCHGVVHGFNGG